MENPIKVSLKAITDVDPVDLASFAAFMCYQAETPVLGEKQIDVEGRLFNPGHHTTLQHFSMSFEIEGIAVGDITTGFHLVSPFYNSDQRSGRFCAEMFLNPDFEKIEDYIRTFWPDVDGGIVFDIIKYIKRGVEIFQSNIDAATIVAEDFLKKERPFLSEKALKTNAPKMAQEQTRVFIPVIFPTGFVYTINLSTLFSLYRAVWSPATKQITQQMVDILLEKYPEIGFMFDPEKRREGEWAFGLGEEGSILNKPSLKIFSASTEYRVPKSEETHPVDLLHFMPEYMNNSLYDVHTFVEMSIATMGQDQRHRTIKRGIPKFTGNFYLPGIPGKLNLENEAKTHLDDWKSFYGEIPETLFMVIAPYGAMVSYPKKASLNALAHEQAKRLCWCAQEEIYHLGRSMRIQIESDFCNSSDLLQVFEPPCYQTGKCVEGDRYCGRNIRAELRTPRGYFPERKV